jgi:hypothetical protein
MKKLLFAIIFLLCAISPAYSFPDDGDGPPIDEPPAPAPIDSSLYVLVIAGVAYSSYRFYKTNPSKTN